MPRTPVFKWDSVKVSLIYVGIFKAPIRTENGEITNTGDLVWAWHSGLPNGRNGLVKYEDGKNVTKNGSYVYTDPTPLPGNIIYYWGVWAWNNSGTQIWFSSRPLKFFVKN